MRNAAITSILGIPLVVLAASGCTITAAVAPFATCDQPFLIEGDTGTWTGTIATMPNALFHCGYTGAERPSMVFAWKPFSTGVAVIGTHGTAGENTVLDVEDGNCSTPLSCNDGYMGVDARVTMNVVAGHVYTLVIGTFSDVSRAVDVNVSVQVTAGAMLDAGSADGGASMLDASADGSADSVDAAVDGAADGGTSDGSTADVNTEDVGGANCPGIPSYTCPAALTCSDGMGGAEQTPMGCGTAPNGAQNICTPLATADGGGVPTGGCLGAVMICFGPEGSVWNCPTRWVTSDGMGGLTRTPNCCHWITNAQIPHGECGVPSSNELDTCAAPSAGMSPES